MEKSDSVVIIPTYNEKENIESIIRAVRGLEAHDFEILIIDDGSPDGTADIVKRLMAGEFKDKLHLVERKQTGPWNGLHCRIQMGAGTWLRLYLRNGCRLQPRP